MNINIFIILILLTFFISISYIYGFRKNYRLIKNVAKRLEEELQPIDKTYTWLGGVVGFSAEYNVVNLSKIKITFSTIPRQSILFLPIAILMGRYDKLELLIPVKKKILNDINIVKKSPLNYINIKSNDLTEKIYLSENSLKFIIYSKNRSDNPNILIKDFASFFKKGLNQLIFSKINNTCYLNIKINKHNFHIINNLIQKLNELC